MISRTCLATAVLLSLVATASAQPGSPALRRSIDAYRLSADLSIRVDGVLDEEGWERAPTASGFVQSRPNPGEPATETTTFQVAYDASSLYIGIRALASDPGALVRRLVRRDGFSEFSDRVFVEIGSPADGRTAFSFGINLAGARQDAVLVNDRNAGDLTWDPVWESAVREFEEGGQAGYVVEVRITFSQLRYDSRSVSPWDFNVQRDIAATGESTYWSPILPEADGYVSQFGALGGLAGLPTVSRVELLPYAAARLTRAPGDAANPFFSENDVTPRVGLDASIGLTSGITLAATVNPDFGQVELDPAVVNLSQFETFFAERRPFFVEGAEAFEFGSTRGAGAYERPTFFYSRRIGQQPYGLYDLYPDTLDAYGAGGAAVYVRQLEVTPIASAAKLSGQAGPWTLGVMTALTLEETADFVVQDPDARVEGALPVSPLSGYVVARASRNWRGGRTVAGGFGSTVLRDAASPAFAPFLPTSAVVGGLDLETATDDRAWTFGAVASGSLVTGDPALITALQRAEQRYYQRPDAGYVEVDPDATSLAGYRTELSIAKTGGGPNWRGGLTLGATSPGFEVNDLGFQERADLLSINGSVEYNLPDPSVDVLNYASIFADVVQAYNYGGESVRESYSLGTYASFSNQWSAQVIGIVRPEYANDRLTRGGPLAARPADAQFSTFVGTNRTKRVSATLSIAGRSEFEGPGAGADPEWTLTVRPRVAFRPSDLLTLTFEPDWVRAYNSDLYWGRETADPGTPGEIDGRLYKFLDYRLESLDLGLRVDWAFSPDLTLQVVAVPKVDALQFGEVRALGAAETFDLVPYDGEDFPAEDYTRLSMRGNAVLRWEWRPGSSLFVVWQQVRDEFTDFAGLGVVDDVPDVFGGELTNVFLVKASYWLGR